MNSFKRVYLSITKRKYKSLILFLVVFLIGNIISGASAILSATENLEQNMKNQIGAKASINLDFSKLSMSSSEPIKTLSIEDVEELSKLSEVKDVSYDIVTPLISDQMKSYRSENSDNNTIITDSSMTTFNATDNFFELKGEKNNNISEFATKEIELKEGKLLEAESNGKQILISEKIAEKNKLKIGDKVSLHTYLPNDVKDPSSKMKHTHDLDFVITGIYKVNQTKNSNNPMSMFLEEIQNNTIYTNFSTVKEVDEMSTDALIKEFPDMCSDASRCKTSVTPTFTLNSVDDLESFKENAYNIIDKDSFIIETSQDAFNKVAGSIINMKDISKLVFIFGVFASVLILSLVLFLFIRERKVEFGIYQALGESKIKSSFQVLYEVLLITLIAITFSLMSGNVLAKNLSQTMIRNQSAQNENQSLEQTMIFDPFEKPLLEVSEEEITSKFKIERSTESILMYYTVMIASASLATGLASISILKLKPREILL